MLALGGFGTASCGGSEKTAKGEGGSGSVSDSQTGSGSGTGEPVSDSVSTSTTTESDGGDPGNPEYLRKRLADGDCEGVEEEAQRVIDQNTEPAVIAEARLARALALGCLGKSAAAAQEVAQLEDSTDLLSAASKRILDRIQTVGTPANRTDLTNVLAPPPTTMTTTITSTATTGTATTITTG